MKILLLEDTASLGIELLRELEQEEHVVKLVHNSRQAILLPRAELESFDVVISDVNMPGGSGLDFLQAIKRLVKRPTPILLHSSDTEAYHHGKKVKLKEFSGNFDYVEFHQKPAGSNFAYIFAFLGKHVD